jgi:hypothetical protein
LGRRQAFPDLADGPMGSERLCFVGEQGPFVVLNEVKHLGNERNHRLFRPWARSFTDAQDDKMVARAQQSRTARD